MSCSTGSVVFDAGKCTRRCPRICDFPAKYDQCPFFPSEVVECYYKYPLKIFIPSHVADCCCKWVYPIIHGGGFVQGDITKISVTIGTKCCVLWTSLSFSRVYSCDDDNSCELHMKYIVDSCSLLCVLPDPVVCFCGAAYSQTNEINITSTSNVVFLDWFTCGRWARGERWEFTCLSTKTSIFLNGKLILREAHSMKNMPLLTVKESMKSYNILGTCILMGPYILNLANNILNVLGKSGKYGEKPQADCIFAVSPFYLENDSTLHGCIIRFASESVHKAYRQLEKHLSPLFTLLGSNPFENK